MTNTTLEAVRIAGVQCNPIVGDCASTIDNILENCHHAHEQGAHVVICGELALNGYPVEDLVLRSAYVDHSLAQVDLLAQRLVHEGLGELVVIVGHVGRGTHSDTGSFEENTPRNAATVVHQGKQALTYWKHALPNYGVFDEKRYFLPGTGLSILEIAGIRLGIIICEDLWDETGPVSRYAEHNVDGLICLNASPYHTYQAQIRHDLIMERSRCIQGPIYYVNIVGGQDDLLFDGDSQFIDATHPHNPILAHAGSFTEEIIFHDISVPLSTDKPAQHATETTHAVSAPDSSHLHSIDSYSIALTDLITSQKTTQLLTPVPSQDKSLSIPGQISDISLSTLWHGLTVAIRDYVHKTGARTVLLGLSGGIDSAVVAALAVDALGSENVFTVAMPSKYSSSSSLADAQDLADATGVSHRVESIENMVDIYIRQLHLTGLAEENIQARCRGMLLMAISNMEGHLVLATGNKSELAVGYSTMYGDAVGAFSPISDVYKTCVYDLARWRNLYSATLGTPAPIPANTIDKAPSAELRPDQKDSDSLPDYGILDAILTRYIEYDEDPEFIAHTVDASLEEILRVCTMVDKAEYKRRQYPLGPKTTIKSFGKDRRVPIINRYYTQWNQRSFPHTL